MTIEHAHLLATLIATEANALLANWREHVKRLPSAKNLDLPTLNDHMPMLFTELVSALRTDSAETIIDSKKVTSPVEHGRQREENAFDIEEVVAEYNILRRCIHDLA